MRTCPGIHKIVVFQKTKHVHFVLGISSFTYGWAIGIEGIPPPQPLGAIDLIHATLDFDLRCLQIGDNLPLHNLSEEQRANLKAAVLKHNVRLEIGARKLTADHLKRYVELAEYFQSPLLRFIIDGDRYAPAISIVKSIIREFEPELRKRNLTLGIENHDRLKAAELAGLMESINSPFVGVCLDCVNSIGAGEGLQQVASLLAPHTVNLHIKDFIVERLSHKMGFSVIGARAGTGLTDIPFLLEAIAPFQRCQSAVLEQWVPPSGDLNETIRREHEWAREGIQYLKSLSWFKTEITDADQNEIK